MVAELFLRLQIYKNDFTALIDHHHGIGCGLQQAAKFRAGLLGFAKIAGNLPKAAQLIVRIPKCGAGGACKKLRTVLSHSYALILVPAVRHRKAQYLLRPAALLFILRKKAREILTDDFTGAIALDSRRAGVRGNYPAFLVQHQNGVVAHFV